MKVGKSLGFYLKLAIVLLTAILEAIAEDDRVRVE